MRRGKEIPSWMYKKAIDIDELKVIKSIVSDRGINTVCSSADCPNVGECFSKQVATFMLLGNICTRDCKFCAVTKGKTGELDKNEPYEVAKASSELKLKHVVLTSVTRDDLPDGGAGHFVETIKKIRELNPKATIEVLIPDLRGDANALQKIIDAKPDIINHNIETIPRLYKDVRPSAVYERSLELLARVKENSNITTKTGIMVGLSESETEVFDVMDDLRKIDCDILTIGQYLQPTDSHVEMVEYIHPDVFEKYKNIGLEKGFKFVASGPFVRSSYNASDAIEQLNKTRNK